MAGNIKSSPIPLGFARAAIAVSASLYFTFLIPIYTAPFGGCELAGFFTLNPHCSDWPEFLRGFLLVACCIIAPAYLRLPLIALFVVLIIALLGGMDAILTGQYNDYGTLMDRLYAFYGAAPILLGGATSYFLCRYGRYVLSSRNTQEEA